MIFQLLLKKKKKGQDKKGNMKIPTQFLFGG